MFELKEYAVFSVYKLKNILGMVVFGGFFFASLVMQGCAPKTPQNSCGYVTSRDGERVSWKRQIPIVMYLEESFPKEYEVAIENSMKSWNSVSDKQLFYLSPQKVNAAEAREKGLNTIFYHPDGGTVEPGKHAETYISFVGDQMIKSDIHFSGVGFDYYMSRGPANRRYNIEAVALHELGHVLGRKHPDETSTNTVMSPKLLENDDRITLSKQDLVDLKCEY